jgi:hypothetical protein
VRVAWAPRSLSGHPRAAVLRPRLRARGRRAEHTERERGRGEEGDAEANPEHREPFQDWHWPSQHYARGKLAKKCGANSSAVTAWPDTPQERPSDAVSVIAHVVTRSPYANGLNENKVPTGQGGARW